jgi:hypothetical protein
VSSLKQTKAQDACGRVTEIWLRWQSAIRYLGPVIEFVPQILIISISLFVIGLIDTLFSATFQLHGGAFESMVSASVLCALIFIAVLVMLLLTTMYTLRRPHTSPFRSKLSDTIRPVVTALLKYLSNVIVHVVPDVQHLPPSSHYIRWLKTIYQGLQAFMMQDDSVESNNEQLSAFNVRAYHSILIRTYDDTLIDEATSALQAVALPSYSYTAHVWDPESNSILELLIYLLSPRASRRSILTTVEAVQCTGKNSLRLPKSCS